MSEDKELVEVWRAEFHDTSPFHENYMSMTDGEYDKMEVEAYWQGFLSAKRSQPSVVLPEQNPMIFGLVGYESNDLHDRLTAAGIKYTVAE